MKVWLSIIINYEFLTAMHGLCCLHCFFACNQYLHGCMCFVSLLLLSYVADITNSIPYMYPHVHDLLCTTVLFVVCTSPTPCIVI